MPESRAALPSAAEPAKTTMESWHPMVVHLPIALILLWPVIDGLGLALGRSDLSALALGLLCATVLFSLFATATGQFAYDAAIENGVSRRLLDTHADSANLVPWLILALAAVRAWLPTKLGRAGHWTAVALGVAAGAFIIVVGASGGELVYEHGVGVKDHPVPSAGAEGR